MNNNHVRAAVMSASSAILAVGILLLQLLRNKNQIEHEIANIDYGRYIYINNILCEGDKKCISIIRMRPISFYKLCDILL